MNPDLQRLFERAMRAPRSPRRDRSPRRNHSPRRSRSPRRSPGPSGRDNRTYARREANAMPQEERIALAIERQKKAALMALAEHDNELKEILTAMAADLSAMDIRLSAIEEKMIKRKDNKKNKDAKNDSENPPPGTSSPSLN